MDRMSSMDNPRQPLIDPVTSGESSSMKYTQPTSPASTTLMMNPIQPKTKGQGRNGKKHPKPQNAEHPSSQDGFLGNLSQRLNARKHLNERLSALTDIMCFIAITSIVLMVIASELNFRHFNDKDTPTSWFIKLINTVLTIILLILVLVYHRVELDMFAVVNGVQSWRVGLSTQKALLILIEFIVCAIHPPPRAYPTQERMLMDELAFNATTPELPPMSYLPLDIGLGLPMFARVFLLGRWVMYHSPLFRTSSAQSFGYLNKVSIDFSFLFKSYLEEWPIRSLTILTVVALIIGTWSMRACNYNDDGTHISYANSLWMFATTYTCIGFADITPTTQCARVMAMIICMAGLLAITLLITVFTQKLVLSRREKYVYDFVSKSELDQDRKNESGNIIKYSVKLWLYKRRNVPMSSIQWHQMQKKLFRAINAVKQIKQDQISILDGCVGPVEIMTTQRSTNETTENIDKKVTKLETNMEKFAEQMLLATDAIREMQNSLRVLTNARSGQ